MSTKTKGEKLNTKPDGAKSVESKPDMKKERNLAFDIIRILAIMLVLYNHHRIAFTYYNYVAAGSVKYYIALFLTVFCKCGPPLFFMVSGALLLGKDEDYSYVFKHRILRILIVMIPCAILKTLTFEKYTNYLRTYLCDLNWYIYAYLAYLFMLPFIRSICKDLDKKKARIFLISVLVAYSISGLGIGLHFPEQITPGMILFTAGKASRVWKLIFPVIGFIIVKFYDEFDKRKMYLILTCGSVISLIAGVLITNLDVMNYKGKSVDDLAQYAILLPTCLIFYTVVDLCKKKDIKNKALRWLIIELSGATFGIYLINAHAATSSRLYGWMQGMLPQMGVYNCQILSIFVEVVILFVIVFLLRLIPGVKKFI